MILTVTPNPALDVTYGVEALRPGTTHRVQNVHERAGGKGINVARVLHQLGRPTLAAAPVAGATGQRLRQELAAVGVPTRLVDLDHGATRRSVTVVAGDEATVFNEPGPVLDRTDTDRLLEGLVGLDAQVAVLSGSLPPGLPDETYATLCRELAPTPCLVDASGPALVGAARAGAAIIKPNLDELRAATGVADPVAGARQLLALGVGAVVVTCGADGLLALTPDGCWRARLAEPLAGNPTGAGDAAAAALAAGLADRLPWPERLREAVAWSAAAVPVPFAGQVDRATLDRVRPDVEILTAEV